MSVAVSAAGYVVAGRILPRVRPRTLMAPGLLLAAAGLALLSTLDAGGGYLSTILPAEILLGAGMGCVLTPAINVVTAGVAPRDARPPRSPTPPCRSARPSASPCSTRSRSAPRAGTKPRTVGAGHRGSRERLR